MTPMLHIPKPKIEPVPLAAGLRWRGGGDYHYAEKMDGEFSIEQAAGCIVAGEKMPDGRFFAFNVARAFGEDITRRPFRERLALLDAWTAIGTQSGYPWQPHWRRPASGNGGEFLETVLARGGEGIVASHWAAPWGVMQFKCKRAETFFCRVTGLDHMRGSAELSDAASGQPRGKLPLRGKFDSVRVGSVLKIEAFGLTERGMLREARLDHDTATSWLVSY
ncbi:MAG: hypothetical protein ABFD89_06860 [Bryobacteraceae bacterium]